MTITVLLINLVLEMSESKQNFEVISRASRQRQVLPFHGEGTHVVSRQRQVPVSSDALCS